MRPALLLVAAISLLARPARAHDFQPGVLAFVETAPGELAMRWTEPVDAQGAPAGVAVVLPPHCRREGDRVSCGGAGLTGPLAFEGLHEARMQVVVSVSRLGGTVEEHLVTGAEPRATLGGSSGDLGDWIRLGVEHIALGLDHLAFLVGLLLIVRGARRLLATITAFTVAHSLTLALAVLGVLRVPAAPVEAAIAASVLLVAWESTHERPTLTRRAPWLVALVVGLVHGLGFAGALGERGLPAGSIGRALLGFNLGVELGQLAILAAVLGAARLVRGALHGRRWPHLAAGYLIGAPAAWWLIARTVAIAAGP